MGDDESGARPALHPRVRWVVVLACACTVLGLVSLVRGTSTTGHVTVVLGLVLVWAIVLLANRRLRLLLGLGVDVAVGTALEDVADLRMGDMLLGRLGYVAAALLTGLGPGGLVATGLGPRLWRQGEALAARWVLGAPAAAAGFVLLYAAALAV